MTYIFISYLVGLGFLIEDKISLKEVFLFFISPISMPLALGMLIRKHFEDETTTS